MPPEKNRTVIVNAKEHEVSSNELSYEDVVSMAFGSAQAGPNITYTVTYRRGTGNKPESSLVAGGTAKVKEGMIFDVTRTDRS